MILKGTFLNKLIVMLVVMLTFSTLVYAYHEENTIFDEFFDGVITGYGVFNPIQYSQNSNQYADAGSIETRDVNQAPSTDDYDIGFSNIPSSASEICTDLLDNDADGKIDCADSDCVADSFCADTNEASGLDDEGFGEGWNQDNQLYSGSNFEQYCTNKKDDDGDGFIDCMDKDCSTDAFCLNAKPEDCTNGEDDDLDGYGDCADSDCSIYPICIGYEICDNNLDDDGDGKVDCKDEVCSMFCSAKTPEICDNNLDDDNDGYLNCEDPNCFVHPACVENNPSAKQLSTVRELTPNEKSKINRDIEKVSTIILEVSAKIDILEKQVEDYPLAVQYLRYADKDLAFAGGRLLRLADEARKGTTTTETVVQVIKGIKSDLERVAENIADASLEIQKEKWRREQEKAKQI